MRVDTSSPVSAPGWVAAEPQFPWLRFTEALGVFLLLLFLLLAALLAMRRESPMQDELVHVPAGVSYWQRQDARLNLEHPLLLKVLAAASVLWLHPRANYRDPSWSEAAGDYEGQWLFGGLFFSRWNHDIPRLIFWARVPMLLVGLVLAALVWWMGRGLGGRWGGLLSLLVLATSPYFLSNVPVVTTDVGVTLFVLGSGWLFATLWGEPTTGHAMGLGLTLAGAFLSKYSAGLLVPALVLAAAWLRWREQKVRGPFRMAPLERCRRRMLLLAVGTAFVSGYLFCLPWMWNTPLERAVSLGVGHGRRLRPWLHVLQGFLDQHGMLARFLMPPLLYLHGVGSTLVGLSRPMYLLGHHYPEGRWFYFPVLMFYKMAPGFLWLLALLAALLIWRALRRRWNEAAFLATASLFDELSPGHGVHNRVLVVLLAVFAGAALASHLNIGLRHFSVPIALLMVLVAWVPRLIQRLPSHQRWTLGLICVGLALGCVFTGLTAFPDYLAYFNAFRGSRPTWQIAADSNLDWGQSLPVVRDFMQQHGIQQIALDSFGSLDRSVYIAHFQPWRCERTRQLPEEWAAVSAGQIAAFTDPPSTCNWLFAYPHWGLAGNSVFIFHRTKAGKTPAKGGNLEVP